jgi:eukaryotic-like serine/threonine-protein kinase
MAELFLGSDERRGELVVVKRILPYLSHEAEFVQMFLDEARIAAQLHHANIIQVHELGKLDDCFFISMEYLEGVDARKILMEEAKLGLALPYGIAAYITSQVCAGLGYAHTATGVDGRPLGVIHRDVSPQNVMVSFDGVVKLVDFGIAKAGALMERSKPGVIKGKFLYLSPEQLSGERLDHRTDLFAVGTMMYELTTGKSPFYKPTTEAVIYAIKTEDPPTPQSLRSDYPPELSRIVMKCLAKDRTKRYQSAVEIKRDLDSFLKVTRPVEAEAIAAYVARLFGTEDDRTLLHVPPPLEERAKPPPPPGRQGPTLPLPVQPPPPEPAAPLPRPPGLPVGRRQTSEHRAQAPMLDEEPPTSTSDPEEVVRLQARAAAVVPPPARRSTGTRYPPAGSDREETDTSQPGASRGAAPSEPSEDTPFPNPAPTADQETQPPSALPPAERRGRRVEDQEAALTLDTAPPPEEELAPELDEEETTSPSRVARSARARSLSASSLRRSPVLFGVLAFAVVLTAGLLIIWIFRMLMIPSEGEWRQDAPSVEAAPTAQQPSESVRPTPAAESPPGKPELPRGNRVPIVFKAPKGTVLLHEGQKIAVGEPYPAQPGRFAFQYQCPGKRLLINGTIQVVASAEEPLVVPLACKFKR